MKGCQARLAQSVERQALNLVVGGSSPPVGDLLLFSLILYDHIRNDKHGTIALVKTAYGIIIKMTDLISRI